MNKPVTFIIASRGVFEHYRRHKDGIIGSMGHQFETAERRYVLVFDQGSMRGIKQDRAEVLCLGDWYRYSGLRDAVIEAERYGFAVRYE